MQDHEMSVFKFRSALDPLPASATFCLRVRVPRERRGAVRILASLEPFSFQLSHRYPIDGSSHFGILTRIIIPLIRPGIAAISILIFMFVWNDYLVNSVLASSESNRTVQVALVRYTQNTVGV